MKNVMAIYIDELVKDLYNNVTQQIELGNRLQDFRKGTLVVKKRREESYYYLSYRDGKKVKTDYLGKLNKEALDKINDELNESVKIKNELKELYNDEIKIRKLIKTIDQHCLIKDVYSILDIIVIIRPILKLYGLKKVYLFGDYSKGLQNEDSEIFLVCEKPKKPINELVDKLSKVTNKEINILVDDSKRSKEYIEEIEDEMMLIYGGY